MTGTAGSPPPPSPLGGSATSLADLAAGSFSRPIRESTLAGYPFGAAPRLPRRPSRVLTIATPPLQEVAGTREVIAPESLTTIVFRRPPTRSKARASAPVAAPRLMIPGPAASSDGREEEAQPGRSQWKVPHVSASRLEGGGVRARGVWATRGMPLTPGTPCVESAGFRRRLMTALKKPRRATAQSIRQPAVGPARPRCGAAPYERLGQFRRPPCLYGGLPRTRPEDDPDARLSAHANAMPAHPLRPARRPADLANCGPVGQSTGADRQVRKKNA